MTHLLLGVRDVKDKIQKHQYNTMLLRQDQGDQPVAQDELLRVHDELVEEAKRVMQGW